MQSSGRSVLGVLGWNRQSWGSWVRLSRNRGATSLSSPPAREPEFFLQALGRDVARDFRARSSGRGRCPLAGSLGVLEPGFGVLGRRNLKTLVDPLRLRGTRDSGGAGATTSGSDPSCGAEGGGRLGLPYPLPSPSPASRAHILCPPAGGGAAFRPPGPQRVKSPAPLMHIHEAATYTPVPPRPTFQSASQTFFFFCLLQPEARRREKPGARPQTVSYWSAGRCDLHNGVEGGASGADPGSHVARSD